MLKVRIKKKLGDFHLDADFETADMFTGVLGPSGCGKSITLKCIAGIEIPDEGYIAIDGKILFDSAKGINLRPQERHVGYLFQNYALFPAMTVKKNILCALNNEKDKRKRMRSYEEIIELLRLEGLEEHKPYQLSGGQAQRVSLARMIIANPDLMLLDEPFSALDAFLKKNIINELSELFRKINKQVVIVTHSQREVRKMTSRLLIMKNGRIIGNGKTEDVFNNPENDDCKMLLEEY